MLVAKRELRRRIKEKEKNFFLIKKEEVKEA